MINVVIIVAIVIALVAIAMLLGGHKAPAPKRANEIQKAQQRLDSYPQLKSWVATWVRKEKGRAFFGNSLSTWEQNGIFHVELRLRESDFSKLELSGTFAQVVWKLEDMCNQ